MIRQKGIIKNNLHKPSFTRSFDSVLPPEFRSAVQPLPFGKCQAGDWRRTPKWLIKSHSDATRASWKNPLMSAVSNVSHRKSHKRQQPSQANYRGRAAAENGLAERRVSTQPRSQQSHHQCCGLDTQHQELAAWAQATGQFGRAYRKTTALPFQHLNFPSLLKKIHPRNWFLRAGNPSDPFLRKSSRHNSKNFTEAIERIGGVASVM